MRQTVIIEAFGEPEVLKLTEEASLPLTENSVRIELKAIGINRADVLQRIGAYHGMKPPVRPGLEGAGVVTESASEKYPVGSRVVIFANRTGLYTTETVANERDICAIPDGVTFEQAAAVPVNWITAWYCLVRLIRLDENDTVLIPAAASGVGTAAIQIARDRGARIIAAASTAEKLELARKLGASFTVNYKEINLVEAIRDITDGKGVSAFLDTVGGATFAEGLKSLGAFGRVAALANVTLENSLINTRDFYPKNAEIYGFQMGQLMASGRYHPADDMATILSKISDGTFSPVIANKFALTDAPAAHRFLEDRVAEGKVLLIP
jgi:NADPH:quinone reductase